jgi:type II secretory pathway pseudopilin PulG
MNRYYHQAKTQSGISLIEALISLAVLSFGLLAIASFQAKLISGSGDNKTKSEAMSLAEQKLDELRSYTTEEKLVANFKGTATTAGELFPEHAFGSLPTLPTAVTMVACDFTATPQPYTTVDDNNNPIAGNNASYTRQWRYCLQDNELLYAAVDVSWGDLDGTTQTVSLDTTVSWKNPAASVRLADIPEKPLVPSATGRAYLGDGSVSDAQLSQGTDNQDGTTTVLKANNGADVALVDSATKEIVLTLVDACKSQDDTCFEFVKIKGRVYFDSSSTATPNDVYVLASDAAYCTRRGNVAASTDTNLVPLATTPNGNYKYFDYTCYLGGGWYGNIGLIITGNSRAKVCVGDPNASFLDGTDKWKRPEVATRRVYRGMLYQLVADGSDDYTLWRTASGTATAHVADPSNLPLYFSKGIQDSAQLPGVTFDTDSNQYVSGWSARWPAMRWPTYPVGHDYVVIRSINGADYTDCITPLTRADSNIDITGDGVADGVGSLFNGAPTDFICLNEEERPSPLPADYVRQYPYLDTFNGDGDNLDGILTAAGVLAVDTGESVYGAPSECPYDPSRPPSSMHTISGKVINTTSSGAFDLRGPTADIATSATTLNTSDGADDCVITASNGDGTELDYTCQVYEWGSGWTGYVNLKPINTVECTATQHAYLNPAIKDSNKTSEDFSCENLAEVLISGSVAINAENDLTGTKITALGDNGMEYDCTPASTAGEFFTYTCNVLELSLGSGWSGVVTITDPDGDGADYSCAPTSWRFDNNPGPMTANATCTGPYSVYHVSGTAKKGVGIADLYTGMTISTAPTGSSTGGTCSWYLVGSDVGYGCDLTVDKRVSSSWTGSIVITPPSTAWCGSTTAISSTSVSISSTPVTLADVSCLAVAPVIFQGTIYDRVTPINDNLWELASPYITVNDDVKGVVATYYSGCIAYWVDYALNDDTTYSCTTQARYNPGEKLNGDLVFTLRAGRKLCVANGAEAINASVPITNAKALDVIVKNFVVVNDTVDCATVSVP